MNGNDHESISFTRITLSKGGFIDDSWAAGVVSYRDAVYMAFFGLSSGSLTV